MRGGAAVALLFLPPAAGVLVGVALSGSEDWADLWVWLLGAGSLAATAVLAHIGSVNAELTDRATRFGVALSMFAWTLTLGTWWGRSNAPWMAWLQQFVQ